jgi:cohesin complex subunit SCC1
LVKIKLAFRPGVVDLPAGSSEASAANLNVAHFGEFDMESGVLELETLPMVDQWMIAATQTTARRQDITLEESDIAAQGDVAEETFGDMNADNWMEFDPTSGDGPDAPEDALEQTADASMDVTDIELPRAAGDGTPLAAALEASGDLGASGVGDADDTFDMPAPDGLDEFGDQSGMMDETTLNMSLLAPDGGQSFGSPRDSLGMGVGNTPLLRVKRARKRKLAVDDKIELTTEHIRDMLADTSDIVRQRIPVSKRHFVGLDEEDPMKLTMEERFKRPCIKGLGPALMHTFHRMMTTGPLPFTLKRKARKEAEEEAEDVEDVEAARAANQSGELQQDEERQEFDEDQQPVMDEFEMPEAALDETTGDMPGADQSFMDENAAPDDPSLDQSGAVDDFGLDETGAVAEEFSLTAVNDFTRDEADDDDPSKKAGHKWHPHTVQLMTMLREKMEHKSKVSYNNLTAGARKRRTAAGCFFEVLQLKTWDYIDVKQREPYGDITITKTKRFDEKIPALGD